MFLALSAALVWVAGLVRKQMIFSAFSLDFRLVTVGRTCEFLQASLQRPYNWHGRSVGWPAYGDPAPGENGNSGCHVAMLCSWFWRRDGCSQVILDLQIRLC